MIGHPLAEARLALLLGALAALLAPTGCGRSPSRSADEAGKLTIVIEPQLVNYHSMAVSWTTTFIDTVSLKYRLCVSEDSTVRTENLPPANYFDISYRSSGQDRIIPVTGFEPSKRFYVWVVAYRDTPSFTIVAESERATFSTCASPYDRISRKPRRVSGHRAVGLGGFLYVAWPDQVFERFDPAVNEWTALPQVPHAHTGFGMAVAGGKLYVIGGENSSNVDEYDPGSGTWASRAPIPDGVSVRAAAASGDTIFTFASTDQLSGDRAWNTYPSDRRVTAYVPATDSWLPRAERPGGSTVLGPTAPFQGKLYLFGGYSTGTTHYSFVQTTFSDTVYLFDPAANAWSFFDRLPDWRVGFHAAATGDAIYILGGLLEWQRTELTWTVPPAFAYNGTRDGWRLKTLLDAPLDFGEDASVVSVGSAIFFVNGGERWPGTTGKYVPGDDACGVDIVVWEDVIPYGIPYTAEGGTKRASQKRITVGDPRPR